MAALTIIAIKDNYNRFFLHAATAVRHVTADMLCVAGVVEPPMEHLVFPMNEMELYQMATYLSWVCRVIILRLAALRTVQQYLSAAAHCILRRCCVCHC